MIILECSGHAVRTLLGIPILLSISDLLKISPLLLKPQKPNFGLIHQLDMVSHMVYLTQRLTLQDYRGSSAHFAGCTLYVYVRIWYQSSSHGLIDAIVPCQGVGIWHFPD